jgi:hypothetical protein
LADAGTAGEAVETLDASSSAGGEPAPVKALAAGIDKEGASSPARSCCV